MAKSSPPSFIRAATGVHTFSILVDGEHVGTVAEATTPMEAVVAWEKVHGPQRSIEAKPQSWSEANQPRQDFQTPPNKPR